MVIIRTFAIVGIIISSSRNIHNIMAEKVLRAKVSFFDENSVGKIITRFSKDIAIVDIVVPFIALLILNGIFRFISVAISIAIINPWIFLLFAIAVVFGIYFVKRGSQATIEC